MISSARRRSAEERRAVDVQTTARKGRLGKSIEDGFEEEEEDDDDDDDAVEEDDDPRCDR